MRVSRILITEMGSVKNKGNMAILNGTMAALSQFFPDAHFTVLTHGPREEIQTYNIRALPAIVEVPVADLPTLTRTMRTILDLHKLVLAMILSSLWSSLKAIFGVDARFLIRYSRLEEYAAADIIVVRGTDTITDQYGRFGLDALIMRCSGILIGVILKKPTIICGHSLGPFKSWIASAIARFVLNRVSLITPREEISRATLDRIGVKNPNVYETADLAFLMEPAPQIRAKDILQREGIRIRKPVVGISASRLISTYVPSKPKKEAYVQYIEFMARITDYLVDNFHAMVIFVPHVIGPGRKYDDRVTSKDILELVHNKKDVKVILGDYSSQELKSIIGLCDLFIGSRMHAVISAVSMHVPSLALSYLYKTRGILRMLGQEEWVCPIQELDYKDTITKIDALWTSKERIRKDLETKMKTVREKALLNAKLIQRLCDREVDNPIQMDLVTLSNR